MNGEKGTEKRTISNSSDDYGIHLSLPPDSPLKTPSEIFENFAGKVSTILVLIKSFTYIVIYRYT